MFLIDCPNIGPRNASEFRFGGEFVERPPNPEDPASDDAWTDFLYMRENKSGVQKEWWYHRPSGTWFIAERHTKTHEIVRTYLWEDRDE